MTVQLQNSPYLPRQRNFPNDSAQELGVELDKAYIDIANRVNERTIGLYSTNLPSITGEAWFLKGQPRKQQTLRQVYEFTGTASFAHGINFANVATFTKITGIGFDGTNYFPIPYLSTNPAFDLGIFVSPTQIILDPGASRTVTSGIIILEWLSKVVTNT